MAGEHAARAALRASLRSSCHRLLPWACALLWCCSACATAADEAEPAALPFEFETLGLLQAELAQPAARLAGRLRRSACGDSRPPVSGAGHYGIGVQSLGNFSEIERGRVDGAYWFLLRNVEVPVPALCGVLIEPAGTDASRITLYGLHPEQQERALRALRKGRLFCECESLADAP